MEEYIYWLCNIKGIGNKTIGVLLHTFKTAKCVYESSEKQISRLLSETQKNQMLESKNNWNISKEYQKLKEQNIRILASYEKDFPQKLREIPDCPMYIYLKGKLPEENRLSVAIIGARSCSEYGKYVASNLGIALSMAGIQVISGMAKGIDSIGQEAAIRAGGYSMAVLGCGVDVCYPEDSRHLYEELMNKGGILSTYPPMTKPKPQFFPPRNRIVSGLADVVVIVEARQKSGTLITVDMALEQGREVYVVPGRITDRLSDGCNNLIKQGASVLLSPDDFVRDIRMQFQDKIYESFSGRKNQCFNCKEKNTSNGVNEPINPENINVFTSLEQEIIRILDIQPQAFEQIKNKIQECRLQECSIQKLKAILTNLCVKGVVKQIGTGWFALVPEEINNNYN